MTVYLIHAVIYLAAAVIAVPVSKRLGLGSVLGYLIAGIIIGPVLGLVGSETTKLQHFAEFGVVMMLFLVGLELEPRMLWDMRRKLMGLGGLQLFLTVLLITSLAMAFGVYWSIAVAIGIVLALSSTAIVLQTFNEKGLAKSEGGRRAFSVLLFQDIAVIPILAFMPLLAQTGTDSQVSKTTTEVSAHGDSLSFIAGLHGWNYALLLFLVIAALGMAGHYLSRPLFKFVANSGLREIFTAMTLLIVIGIAALMSLVGLSPALGTFLAGVILATSEFRHELESTIEPFKGLLLGLFFITVGAGINFAVFSEQAMLVIGLALAVMLIKALVLFIIARLFKFTNNDTWLFTLSLAQAGEFGFVLLSFSVQNNIIPQDLSEILLLVVALTMLLTPLLFVFYEKVIVALYQEDTNKPDADNIDEPGTVIVAGLGRFGQIVNRLLIAHDIKTVALDHEVNQIEIMRRLHIKSYFGDATQPDLLRTAGIEDAKVLVVAIDDGLRAIDLVKYVKQTYPRVKVFARAFDRKHHYELRLAGADYVISETYYSSLEMGKKVLEGIGMSEEQAQKQRDAFQKIEASYKDSLYESWRDSTEENKFTNDFRKIFIQVESVLSEAMKNECQKKNIDRFSDETKTK